MKPKKGNYTRLSGSWSGVYFNGYKWVRFECTMCARLDGLAIKCVGHTKRTTEMCLMTRSEFPDRHRCKGKEGHKEFMLRKAEGSLP